VTFPPPAPPPSSSPLPLPLPPLPSGPPARWRDHRGLVLALTVCFGVMLVSSALLAIALANRISVIHDVRGGDFTNILQRAQAEFRIPVARNLTLGAMGEYFYREAYFWQNGTRTDESAQFRVFLTWSRR